MRKLLLSTSALAFAAGVTSVSAADLGVGEIIEAPVYLAEGFSWNGLYFGGSVGWAWHDRDSGNAECGDGGPDADDFELDETVAIGLDDLFGIELDSLTPDLSCFAEQAGGDEETDDIFHIFENGEEGGSDDGWMASLFVGVNRQYGNFVVGTELEGVWLDSNGSSQDFVFAHQDRDTDIIDPVEIIDFD